MRPALKGHGSSITALLYDPTSSQVSNLQWQHSSLCATTMLLGHIMCHVL